MKTVTEFPGVVIRQVLKTKQDLLSNGTTEELLGEGLGQAYKVEGDRLKHLMKAIELSAPQIEHLARVRVFAAEAEAPTPQGAVKDGEHFYMVEVTSFAKPDRGGRDRNDRDPKGRGGRDKGRGGKGRDGGGRGGDRPRSGDLSSAPGGRPGGSPGGSRDAAARTPHPVQNSLKIVITPRPAQPAGTGVTAAAGEVKPRESKPRPPREPRKPREPKPPVSLDTKAAVIKPLNGEPIQIQARPAPAVTAPAAASQPVIAPAQEAAAVSAVTSESSSPSTSDAPEAQATAS